jgi:5-amino-6-(5-phospho-D-ribitylamino)uracil phosphatase
MAYRMIAIDLDGTLLSPDGSVSLRNRLAVRKALEAGLLVCFATGRNWTESQTILDAVEHYDTAVFVGGAMVIDTRNGQTLHRMGMQPQLAREICSVIESLGHAALALQDTGQTGVDYYATAGVQMNEATLRWMEVTTAKVRPMPNLSEYSHEHTIRVGIVAAPNEVVRVKQIVKQRLGERVLCQILYVPAYAVEVMEVFDPAVNKWEGVLHAARRHGVEPHDIVAIGDDVNDIPMIANAGLGVAMGNAKAEVKAVAKRVIKSNQEDGLADFLEELVALHVVEPAEDRHTAP